MMLHLELHQVGMVLLLYRAFVTYQYEKEESR